MNIRLSEKQNQQDDDKRYCVMANLVENVRDFFQIPHPDKSGRLLLLPDEHLIVAVSGGPDSLALLHLLAEQNIHLAKFIVVVHLDHALRENSARDADFVRKFAESIGAPWAITRIDVRAQAEEFGLSIEEAGRIARYRYLEEVAHCNDASVVVTGHNANDQVETILMNLLRGSGPKGLRGMQPISKMPGSETIFLARPLLTTAREDIVSYCHEYDLSPLVDESNADPKYYRNWIRGELLPLISGRNPGIHERLLQTAHIISADYELIDSLLHDTWSFLVHDEGPGWLRLDMNVWRVLPTSLKRGTLRKAVSQVRSSESDIGFQTIELARKVAETGRVGSESTLPDGVVLSLGYDQMIIALPTAEIPPIDVPQLPNRSDTILPVPGVVELAGGWRIEAKLIDNVSLAAASRNDDPLRALVALSQSGEFVTRSSKSGERFQPLGMGGLTASVGDVMINRKIPQEYRNLWPIVANSQHLVWLVGHQIDHRARLIRENSPAVLLTLIREEVPSNPDTGTIPLQKM